MSQLEVFTPTPSIRSSLQIRLLRLLRHTIPFTTANFVPPNTIQLRQTKHNNIHDTESNHGLVTLSIERSVVFPVDVRDYNSPGLEEHVVQ
jgi:hypothetical protein